MSDEGSLQKRVVTLRIPIETCMKVERKFTLAGDNGVRMAYCRALKEATRDVLLTLGDLEALKAEEMANRERRMAKRTLKK